MILCPSWPHLTPPPPGQPCWQNRFRIYYIDTLVDNIWLHFYDSFTSIFFFIKQQFINSLDRKLHKFVLWRKKSPSIKSKFEIQGLHMDFIVYFSFSTKEKKTLINYSHEYKKVLLYTSFCQQIVFKRLNNII